MSTLDADTPVQYVKGVGPRRAEWFSDLGLRTVGDLLAHFPIRYELHCGEIDIADLQPGTRATVRGEIQRISMRRGTCVAELCDGTETCRLRWFQPPPRASQSLLREGVLVLAAGQVREYNDAPEIIQPSLSPMPEGPAARDAAPSGARLVGVYSASEKLPSRLIARTVAQVLAQGAIPFAEFLPPTILERHRFPPRGVAIRRMHAPESERAAQQARRRLAYEELLLLELAMAVRRQRNVVLTPGRRLRITAEIDRRIRARFPFQLTTAQNKAISEIVRDLGSGRPMTRLLQGDVGSGKTVVALYTALGAIANRCQAAIMAPTEVLAQQHYRNISRYLYGSRVRCLLLSGGLSRRERSAALSEIQAGELDLVIGTQALIESDVAFRDLALVVVDEQHKFGVVQRHAMRTKGPQPHYLVMTATPIPRTLAMTIFGDLDVSLIRQSPPGRGRIVTRVVPAAKRSTVLDYVRKRLEAGEQAYVVCPRIGDDNEAESKPDLASARSTYDELVNGPWQGLNVGLLHGALPADQKESTVRAFAAGNLHALVATTVVEVGIDVPSATIMVVEQAERFGLSQLHQLRGRVGRGSRDSLCVLISGAASRAAAMIARDSRQAAGAVVREPSISSSAAAERLAVLARTSDGFRIAEADLRLRGPGEFLGTRQHGLPDLRVASLVDDGELLELARADAFEIIAGDPALRRPEHTALIPELRRMFGDKLALIDAA
jgi:ATP-dependent DNA helicase RecG